MIYLFGQVVYFDYARAANGDKDSRNASISANVHPLKVVFVSHPKRNIATSQDMPREIRECVMLIVPSKCFDGAGLGSLVFRLNNCCNRTFTALQINPGEKKNARIRTAQSNSPEPEMLNIASTLNPQPSTLNPLASAVSGRSF